MPFFVGDYLADTTHLTVTEHGAYMLLLMAMWRGDGTLPDDDAKLARFSRCTNGQWARMRDTIMDFFDVGDGVVTHGRLLRELTKHAEAVEQRRHAASNGGKAKALKDKELALAAGTLPACQPEPEPKIEETKNVSSITSLALVKPNGFARFWEAYPNKSGKRDAEKAYIRALRRAEGPDPPRTILDGVERAKSSRKWREGFIKNPSTWLNQDCWTDEETPEANPHERLNPTDKRTAREDNLGRGFAVAMAVAGARTNG